MLTTRSITISALALLGADVAVAQNTAGDSLVPRFTIGATHTIAGAIRFSDGALDSRMAAAGLPRLASSAPTLGIGADIRTGRLIFGGSFQAIIGRDNKDAQYRSRISGSYTLLDAGVAALRTSAWSAYPMVGVGATSLSINVKETARFSFDDGLARPGRELAMSGKSALVHAGMLVERRFRTKSSEYALGIRFGVTRTIGSQLWMSDAARVNDGPRASEARYVRLSFARPMKRRRDAVLPIGGSIVQAVAR
ncbi:MAG TPA: hypothetical protein VEB19_11625 [Gemmatimonadaceae bacterium]|nr:hypothetical protein [Gemmatimonadaceae bacterium]